MKKTKRAPMACYTFDKLGTVIKIRLDDGSEFVGEAPDAYRTAANLKFEKKGEAEAP